MERYSYPKKYGVFTKNREFAREYISAIAKKEEIKYYFSRREVSLYLKNGDIYKWVPINGSSKGFRVNTAIIDISTCNIREIRELIYPCIVPHGNTIIVYSDALKIIKRENLYMSVDELIDLLTKIKYIKGNISIDDDNVRPFLYTLLNRGDML